MHVPVRKTSFNAGEWSPALQARIDLQKYGSAAKRMINAVPSVSGSVSNRGGTAFVGAAASNTYKSRLIPFTFSTTQAYVLEFSNTKIRVIMDGGIVVYSSGGSAGQPVVVTSPYVEADIPYLRFTQSFDVLYIFHSNYAPRKLTRTAHDAWTLSTVTFGSGVSAPTNLTPTGSGGSYLVWKYAVTAVNKFGEESLISNEVSGAEIPPITLSWDAVTGATGYKIYRRSSTAAGNSYGLIGTASGTSFQDSQTDQEGNVLFLDIDTSKAPPIAQSLFGTTGDYPAVATFCEQRLVLGRTDNDPQSIFGSQTSSFENFNISYPLLDSDSYEHELNSTKANAIRWMLDLNGLVVGTDTAEIKVTGSGGAITPSDVSAVKRSYYGSNDLPPQIAGSSILIVTPNGNTVRALDYDFNTDAFNAPDLTIAARHLLADYKIVDWAFQSSPNSTLWCIRNDGKLLGLTYDKDQEVIAWHQHETDGLFESIAVVVNDDGGYDLYTVVKRTINGSAKRYVELFKEGLPLDETTFERKVEDAFFLDCALTATSTVSFTHITGLSHLEGKTVNALADGEVVRGKTVSSGAIDLDTACNTVTVGLPYTSIVETLDFDTQQVNGVSIQNGIRGITECVLRLENTRSLQVGSSEDTLYDIPFIDDDTVVSGEPTPLFTGDKELRIDLDAYKQARMVFKNTYPLPFTVLGIFAKVDVEDFEQ